MAFTSDDERRRYQREYYKRKIRPKRQQRKHDRHREEKKTLIAFRCPISVIGRVRRIVNEGIALGKFPWKTQTECLTALIIRGMETLAGDSTIEEMMPYLRAQQQMEVIATHRREAQAAFSSVKTEIAALLEIHALDEAVKYFHGMLDTIDDMDEQIWRDWLLRELKQTFPKLLAMKPKRLRFGPHPGKALKRTKARSKVMAKAAIRHKR